MTTSFLCRLSTALLMLSALAGLTLAQEVEAAPPEESISVRDQTVQDLDQMDPTGGLQDSKSRLSDVAIPLQIGEIPSRTAPLLEIGNPFLGRGPISEGFNLPTGANWNPSLYVFGTLRTAIQGFDDGEEFYSEWANRLDIYGNMQFTPTERILIGFRPLDFRGEQFSGFIFGPESRDGWQNGLNGRVTTLFFEGDIGEIFPGLDEDDTGLLDFGFAVGRQRLVIQDGILIDDTVDGFGIIRNTLKPDGFSNLRFTFFYAWNEIHRTNRVDDSGADLFALFTEADFGDSTFAVDLVLVDSNKRRGDSFHFGLSAIQRIGHFNLTARLLGSVTLDRETAFARDGLLLFGELSWTPTGTEDLYYINAYLGVDNYSSAARAPDTGGPLARIGILYAAQGLGQFGSALNSEPADSFGLAFGRQFFWDEYRSQFILEVGGRVDTDGQDDAALACAVRYQRALAQNFLVQMDLHARIQENRGPGYGMRLELTIKF